MIVLDLDGVLCDWSRAASLVHGQPYTDPLTWNWYETWGLTAAEFWDVIHAEGDRFYAEFVLPYPWARDVLCAVGCSDDFVVMTSPSNHPSGYSGKKVWVDKWLPGVKLIVGSEKHLLAGDDRLLIDDNLDNVQKFRDAGGYAHLFRQPWNHGQYENRMEILRSELRFWREQRQAPAKLTKYDRNGSH